MGSIFMRKDKEKALKLRLSGKSYGEIRSLLGIPKSTLSTWFSELQLSSKAQKRILSKARKRSIAVLIQRNKSQTYLAQQRKRLIISKSSQEIKSMTQNELKIAGIALYWAEGYKRPQIKNGREITSHAVSFANSDPKLIGLFLRFIRETCSVSENKIKVGIHIYEHHNEKEIVSYWQKVTKLPRNNFGKVYRGVSVSSKRKRPYNRLPYGTIQIRINDTILFHKIMGWIKGIKKFSN